MSSHPQKIYIQYFALLREKSGVQEETLETIAKTPHELYIELKARYQFTFNENQLRVAINNKFVHWDSPLTSEDQIVFIPPVAGG